MKKIPQLSDLSDEDEGSSGRTPSAGDPGASGEPLAGRDVGAGAAPPDELPAADPAGDGEASTSTGAALLVSRADGTEPSGKGAGPPATDNRKPGARSGGGVGAGKVSRSRARRHARERALQALYQWDLASAESSDVRRQFIDGQDMSRVDVEYFERLFRGVSHDVETVDEALGRALDRPIGDLDPIERAVLRVAAFELAEVPETPARVVINEGVEITKRFGADNGHRYVNGVLDRLAGLLRPREMRRG